MNISNQFTRKKGLNKPWLYLVEKSYFKHIAVSAVYTTKFSKNTQPLKQFSTYYSQKLHNNSSIISCEKSTENDNQSNRHMFDLRLGDFHSFEMIIADKVIVLSRYDTLMSNGDTTPQFFQIELVEKCRQLPKPL